MKKSCLHLLKVHLSCAVTFPLNLDIENECILVFFPYLTQFWFIFTSIRRV